MIYPLFQSLKNKVFLWLDGVKANSCFPGSVTMKVANPMGTQGLDLLPFARFFHALMVRIAGHRKRVVADFHAGASDGRDHIDSSGFTDV